MTNKKTVVHYAHSTHGQPNKNNALASLKNNWKTEGNASATDVTKAPNGSATSFYSAKVKNKTKKETTYDITMPWTFTGVDYQFDIPKCAYVTNIKFEVPMKIDGSITVEAPNARFNFYNGTKSVKDNVKEGTGWNNGYYNSNTGRKLSNSWKTFTYEMSGSEFHKRGYPTSECNRTIIGIDLRWKTPIKMPIGAAIPTHKVYIKYVKCTITYELPDETVTFDRTTSGDNPRLVTTGEWYNMDITYQNKSNSRCCDSQGNPIERELKIKFPPNAQISWASFNNTDYNERTGIWTVPCTANDWESISFSVRDWGSGLDKITVTGIGKTWNYWVYNVPQSVDVGYVTGYAGTMQKDVNSCITFVSKVNASDGIADYTISLVNDYEIPSQLPAATNVVWTLDEEKSSSGVSIIYTTDNHVRVSVPAGEAVDVVFTGCFAPKFTGQAFAEAALDDKPGYGCSVEYTVIEPPVYIVRNKPILDPYDRTTEEITFYPSIIDFKTHRVATSTEIGAYVIDCGIADLDANMIEDNCTLSSHVWEKLDYIGTVPLEYHHYDPDSTYSNKAISESYKNKTYKGKEGVIDEDISLKFKVRPKKTPELQGLVKLDKPTPINANHKCFEGDPLNHRGWVVLSEVKFKRTNPLWYDCEAKVDYITHDIHTKFQIFKELKVNTKNMPEIMAETFELGDNLSTALDIFNVDTDGGFVYDEDSEDGAKNLFSLDEGQHLMIGTRNPLKNVSQIRFDWYSTKILENRENTMERVFRLKDSNGDSILEYEYTNFQYFDDYVTCDIIVRVKNDGESWNTQTYNDVDLRTEIEADPIADDGTDDDATETIIDVPDDEIEEDIYDDEVAYDENYIAPTFDPTKYDVTTIYGTSLEFLINGNKLSIYDSGYNGREVTIEDISLLKSNSYTFETYWENKNVDGMTEDVLSYIDIELAETLLSTDYSQYYSNIMVSPFPIPYKTVLFTRESEEGTIYYLTGDEPFKYRIEPFYQYYCGCDLVTRDGVSIFDLNNSYDYFYIENGLVRLGFNKFNGRLFLAKWDIISKDWVTTHYFHMSNDVKFSLESYSDDKIVIKAGTNTFFTIWRGHPYIGVKNPNDTIFIDSNFNYCLSDKVDGVKEDYPKIYSFLNQNNILPECIGGTKIDYDCMMVDDDQITPGTDHTIELIAPSPAPTAQVPTTLDVTVGPSGTIDGSVHYLIDNIDVATQEYPFDLTYTFLDKGEHTVQAVYVGDDDDNIAFSEKIVVKVGNPPVDPNGKIAHNNQHQIAGEYNLRIISAPKKFTYKDGKQVVLQLTKGSTPIRGYTIEHNMPDGSTWTGVTDAEGKTKQTNIGYEAGKHQWGGRFYDVLDDDSNGVLVCKALRWIEIEKAKPSFKYNATSGKINKGKNLVIKLMGVNAPRQGQTLTYTINGGSKKSKKTNAKGNIHIAMNTKGTFKIKVMYAGTKNYEAISKTFTVKVV